VILSKIVESKKAEVKELPRAAARKRGTPLPVAERLKRDANDPLRLITEIKFKSPSAGPLSRALNAGERAVAYARGGASMISVLCDSPFFDGSFDHLRIAGEALAAANLSVPLLAKEFVIDARQIDHAYAAGADAVLLIVRIVSDEELAALLTHTSSLGMAALVEVANRTEIARAVGAGAQLIGVNARDLDALTIDMAEAARALEEIPANVVKAHLSGVKRAEDVARVAASSADAALIGEVLMRADDPSPLLAEFAKHGVRSEG